MPRARPTQMLRRTARRQHKVTSPVLLPVALKLLRRSALVFSPRRLLPVLWLIPVRLELGRVLPDEACSTGLQRVAMVSLCV